MKRLFVLLGLLCLISLLSACAPQPEQQVVPVSEETPSSEDDLVAVKAILASWSEAFNSGDLEGLVSLYADDAVRMSQNMPAASGRDAILANFQNGLSQYEPYALEVELSIEDHLLEGDLAVIRGLTKATFTHTVSGETVHGTSKWVLVDERQPDGSWKIVWDIWNRDAGLPEAFGT